MTNSLVLGNFHGLGDSVLLTAPLKRLKELHSDLDIYLLTLKRFGDTSKNLYSDLPFLKEVNPILSDAWNDFKTYSDGLNEVSKQSLQFAKDNHLDYSKVLYCLRDGAAMSLRNHKVMRFAKELGIKYGDRTQLRPQINVLSSYILKAKEFLSQYPKPHVLLHLQGGNEKKTLKNDVINLPKDGTVFEFGDIVERKQENHVLLGLPNIEFTKALVSLADKVIAIDSIIMHLGITFETPTTAIFTMTPIVQIVPLWKPLKDCPVEFVFPPNSICNEGLDKLEHHLEEYFK